MRPALLVMLLATSCSAGLGAAGAHCSNSEECAAGLLCDTTQTPHICSTTLAHVRDLAMPGEDLAGIGDVDLAYLQDMHAMTGDLAGTPPPDMSAVVHDMAEPKGDM